MIKSYTIKYNNIENLDVKIFWDSVKSFIKKKILKFLLNKGSLIFDISLDDKSSKEYREDFLQQQRI